MIFDEELADEICLGEEVRVFKLFQRTIWELYNLTFQCHSDHEHTGGKGLIDTEFANPYVDPFEVRPELSVLETTSSGKSDEEDSALDVRTGFGAWYNPVLVTT